MNPHQDQHFIDRVLEGESQAFEILIDRYKHMVYTLAYRMVKNREDAEEIAQDSFLKAFTRLNSFKGSARFSTWLYKIAYHKSLDYIKGQKRIVTTGAQDITEVYTLASIESGIDILELKDRKRLIKDAIEALSPDDGVLLTLHYFEELSLKEIAEILEVSANTIKVRLHRSRKRLADILRKKLEPEDILSYGNK
jgi:RNA polymerase sigma-70 factor (ECF subfamily)